MKKIQTVSVIAPTLNAEKYLPAYFREIERQSYPKKYLEVVVADGGSTDNTIIIAKKHKAKVVNNPFIQGQPGVYVGMQHAKGDIFIILAVDNIFKSPKAIESIVNIFNKDKSIYAVFPKHISSKKDSLFTQYINTFTDPLNHFLYGKASNARTFNKIYKTIEENKDYDIYDFKRSKIKPILGLAQGMTIKSDFIKVWKEKYDDILPIIKLSNKDKKIAYAHSVELYHHTVRDIKHYFRKQRWATRNALENVTYGLTIRKKYLTLDQRIKMYIFLPYALSFIFPLIYSCIMFVKDRKTIWLFHPFISFVTIIAILYEYLRFKLNLNAEVSRL